MSTASGERSRQRTDRPPLTEERARGPRELIAWVALAVVAALAAVLVALHIDASRPMSPYDEAQHFDYVNRLLEGELPAAGDIWLPATIETTTCRTIDDATPLPSCSASADLDDLPNQGYNTAYIHTPTYYLVAAGAVLADDALGLTADDLDVMRATGALWLIVALVLMWLLSRSLGVPWQARAGLSLALSATPIVLLVQSTVTNDATALAAGSAVLLATLRWERGDAGLWLPVGVALLALLLKATNLAVLVAACAFVLIRAAQREGTVEDRLRRALSRRNLLLVASLGLLTGLVAIGWSVLSNARATVDASLFDQNANFAAYRFDPTWLVTSLMSLASPLKPQFFPSVVAESAAAVAVANLANAGLMALAVVGAARAQAGSVVRALALALGVAMLAFGPLLTVFNYVSAGLQFGIPARYGLSLVAGLAAVAGLSVRTARGGWVLLVLGAIGYASIAWALLS